MRTTLLSAIALLLFSASGAVAAPANDNFANAPTIGLGTTSGNNIGATRQAGDPDNLDGSPTGGKTVWWKYTPSANANVTVATVLAGASDEAQSTFDTQLGVYQGALGAFNVVAENEDVNDPSLGQFNNRSRATFNAVAGQTYYIMVDGYAGEEGLIKLYLTTGGSPIRYALNMSAFPADAGTISLSPTQPAGGYAAGTVVIATATSNPNKGSFLYWSGDTSGTEHTTEQRILRIPMDQPRSITANFVTEPTANYSLTVSANPNAGGTVTVLDAPNADNGTTYTPGSSVRVRATPAANYRFTGWSGDASGTANPVTVAMNGNKTVTANFEPESFALVVNVTPQGSGNVEVSPAPNGPNNTYLFGTQVTLNAVPQSGQRFTGFSGALTGATTPRTLTMDANKTVTASFTPDSTATNFYTLTLNSTPSGTGSIQASPAPGPSGYAAGTVVQLTAVPATGQRFKNWSGAASGTASPITVVMDANKAVTAVFEAAPSVNYTLSLTVNPGGSGTIQATPAPGANGYAAGTVVQLTAIPATGQRFKNWTGAASGSANPISVTMDANRSVTANFETTTASTYSLTLNSDPAIGGSVAASPSPNGADGKYVDGTVVTLNAQPSAGYRFVRWNGAASGSNPQVNVTLGADRTVTATFELVPVQTFYTLSVTREPSSGGSITATPAPNGPNNTYLAGTTVSLRARAVSGNIFTGWNGDLSGTANPQSLVISGDKNVVANFSTQPTNPTRAPLSAVVNTPNTGRVSPNLNGRSLVIGKTYSLRAVPAKGHIFVGWTGLDGLQTDSRIRFQMEEGLSLVANFAPNPFLKVAGTYNGLVGIAGPNDMAGTITLKVRDDGRYNAKLKLGSGGHSFNGQFDTNGQSTVTAENGRVVLRLVVDLNGETDRLTGSLRVDETSVPIEGDRAVLNARTFPSNRAGRYTLVFQGNSVIQGNGYATLTVTTSGKATLSGELADGSRIRQRSTISKNGRLPIYQRLEAGRGSLIGFLDVSSAFENSVSGAVHWTKPANAGRRGYPEGFTTDLNVIGSTFVIPAAGRPFFNWVNGLVVITGGNVLDTVANAITIDSNNRITVVGPNAANLSLTISRTGLLVGRFNHPVTGRTTTVKGVVLMNRDEALGYFLGTDLSGAVQLRAQ